MIISEIKGDKTFSFCFLSVLGEPIIAEKNKRQTKYAPPPPLTPKAHESKSTENGIELGF